MPLKNAGKLFIEAARAANEEPRAPKGGRGLLSSIPGKRPRRLMDIAGDLTPAGTYYYEKAAREAPTHGFDKKQEPTRKGARVHIKMLDGTTAAVKTWDNTGGQWKFTKLGKRLYKDSTDTDLVTFSRP